jgi:hypothetical protein
MRILLDTNILVHAYNRDSPHNKTASQLIAQIIDSENETYIALQSIHEFYAVITSPRRVEKPLTPRRAKQLTETILRTPKIQKLTQTQETTTEALTLADKHNIKGSDFFDCLIAITAIKNEIDLIYTENIKDFKHYEIKTETPLNK